MPRSATDALTSKINSRFGEGTLTTANDPKYDIERIPTGVLSVDHLIGGGFVRGRHIELYGNPATGKTSLSLRAIATAQAMGEHCAYFDTEGTFDRHYAEHLGVDTRKLVYHRQESGNQLFDIVETLLRSKEYGLIVLDSIAAIIPAAELEKELDAATMGTELARLMSRGLKKLTTANSRTAIVWINQVRESTSMFGKKWVTSGGRAMGFYATTRLEMVQSENLTKKRMIIHPDKGEQTKDVVRGHRVMVRIEKEKSGGGKRNESAPFVIDYDLSDIDPIEDVLYVGQVTGVVTRKGNTWTVADEEFKQPSRVRRFLRENPEVLEALEREIRDVAGLAQLVGRKAKPEEAEPVERKKRAKKGKKGGRQASARER